MLKARRRAYCSGNGYHRYKRHTYSLAVLASFTAMRSVSGQCCEVKQHRVRLVAGWVTQALEQGRQGSCAHAGNHQYCNILKTPRGTQP